MIDPREWEGKVYVGDCLEFLRELPDGCVDAVVTDPPYGVGLKCAEGTPPDDEYPLNALRECLRVSHGPVLAFGAASVRCLEAALSLKPDRMLVWHPSFTLSKTSSNGMFWRWHPLWAWRLPKKQDALWSDVLTDNCDGHNWWNHPATKPESLMAKVVDATEGSILDPFLGSGTTAVVCERLGRRWIGCEINPEYVAIAEKRIERERQNRPLPLVSSAASGTRTGRGGNGEATGSLW